MSQAGPPVSPQSYEARSVSRQTSPQMQYLQPSPTEPYKAKSSSSVNPRSFKMPSPPLVPVASPQVSVSVEEVRRLVGGVVSDEYTRYVRQLASGGAGGAGGGAARNKEQFRSHSLPLGAQLNPDWSVSAPAQAQPLDAPDTKHTARVCAYMYCLCINNILLPG